MRRTALLSVVVVFLAAAVFAATASASTTYHGKFTSGTGMHKTLGLQTVGASGTWNVIVRAGATRITGVVFVHHTHTDMITLAENPSTGHLGTGLVTWTDAAWSGGVLTAHGSVMYPGVVPDWSVGLTFTLEPTATVPVKLYFDLTTNWVSPAGWLYWDITGDLSP
jgi:hypothetical protein